MSKIFKDIIVEKKGKEFLKILTKKINEINKNGGYAYIGDNTIRMQKETDILYLHRFELNYKGEEFVHYYFGNDGFDTLTYNEFIEKLEVLLNDSTKKSS